MNNKFNTLENERERKKERKRESHNYTHKRDRIIDDKFKHNWIQKNMKHGIKIKHLSRTIWDEIFKKKAYKTE